MLRRILWTAFLLLGLVPYTGVAATTTVVTEAQYVMGDGDTLAMAEARVLQRAQRRAVEEAGVYLESTFRDSELYVNGVTRQSSAVEIRTLAAAVTKTDILESRRAFEQDRPTFYVRIRAEVDLDHLQEAIRRWRSEQQFAEHFRRLQKENAELKTQLRELQTRPAGVRMLTIEPEEKHARYHLARKLLQDAMDTGDLRRKLDFTSQAAVLDPQSADPLILRGQTYLRLVSLAYADKAKPSQYSLYVDNARMDFDRALLLDPKNTWALLGKGDAYTWLKRPAEAARAYEDALLLNPFFDVARQRLITLHTTEARKLTAQKEWSAALAVLNRLLNQQTPDSWIPYEKEAYLLRSQVYRKLRQPTLAAQDLSTVLQVDPTNADALLARGTIYREQLQGGAAKEDLEHACLLGSAPACAQLP